MARAAVVVGGQVIGAAVLMPVYLDETVYSSPRSKSASEPDEHGVCWIRLCFE